MSDVNSISQVDWPKFLTKQDMLFSKLPGRWQEAPHFGNAMIGSMLYQADNAIRLQVFRSDVRDHRDESYGWTAYSRPRLLIGYFELKTEGTLNGCDWRKNLWDAELHGVIKTDRGEIEIRHFVHADDMAIVTELRPCRGEEAASWSWHPHVAYTSRPGYPSNDEELKTFAKRYGEHYKDSLKPLTKNPDGHLKQLGDTSVWNQDLLAGGQYAVAWTERAADGLRSLIITISKTYPSCDAADKAVQDVALFAELDREDWISKHRDWWHLYYRQSFVEIPDKELERLYWQSVYRYGCTSRSGRAYVDTSGLWLQGGPWPYSTHDFNTQTAHWAVYAANRLEQGEEIVNSLHRNLQNMINAVHPAEWREDSAYLHLATAEDMLAGRMSDMRYYHLAGCLPWILHNAWLQYRFSMDDQMLREKIFPLLQRAANFYFHLVEEDENGVIHLSPTYSPETGIWKDCNFDLALFKWCCHTLLWACRRLNVKNPLEVKWQDVIDRLIDFPSDQKGFMLGANEPSKPKHRHFSNLLIIYPLHLVNIEQEGRAQILTASAARAHNTRGLDAMVQTHAAPISAALGLGDQALEGVLRQAADLHSNGLWSCSDNPCIESSLSLMNNIQEMLIQSWTDPAAIEPGPIRIFPALPASWRDVLFCDLRAEGAFLVSAERRNGRTIWVRVKSLAGEPCRIRPGFEGSVSVLATNPDCIRSIDSGIYTVELKAGEEVRLTAR